MKVRTINRQFKEGLTGLWRNRVMSLASISSVTAVLLVLGLFLMITLNMSSIIVSVESDVEIKAFLKNDLTTSDVNTIGKKIEQVYGIKNITFESKEEALQKYKEKLGDNSDLLEGLEGENNPFPSSYIIKVKDPNTIGSIAQEMETFEGVEEVKYGKDIVNQLLKATHFIRIIGTALICIFALISIFIISNTIKLTVAARRKEISIMKYVGATNGFIRLPFIIEGLVLGVLGAVLASGILLLAYNYFILFVDRNFEGLYVYLSGRLAPVYDTMLLTTLLLLAAGILVGTIGSRISLRKFLKV